jgi:two-component system chemotaxis sensor kinase CheA
MFSDPPAPAPESGDAAGQPEPATERSLPTPELIPPPEAVARGPVANTTARNDFIRVDARKVSQVMDLAGEIGLACSAVTHHPEVEGKDLEGFSAAAHKLEMLVRELQTEISAMRLIPIATVFRSMKRVVRDTARRTGKEVDLIVTGEDTEIDKVTVEALHDPLVHLLRNAIDHGLESPQERVAAGKRATGRVLLDASHEGGEVLIRVSDDGRGIQRERVLARAFALGLADPAVKLSDNEIVSLIFRPGFSTKMQIDELSGRGVGMDVIKTSIERLRGRVRMHSEAGKGSSVSLTVPLTLAFLDAMVVRDGEHLYAIPIEKVQEVFTTREGQLCPSSAEGRTGLRVRDEVVPVLRLADYYAQRPLSATLPVGTVVVVVQSLRGPLAIGVDALHGNQPVMLKPLAGLVSQVRAAVGCAMLRSGDVALTLDCDQLDV